MTNVVFVVSRAEPEGGGEGDFLKPCLQTDPDDCFPFTASSLEGKKKKGLSRSASLHTEREMHFPRETTKAVTGGRNLM